MTMIIAHRGNVYGAKPESENNPGYIDECIRAGYYAEIDLHFTAKGFELGHDEPQYKVDGSWLLKQAPMLFIHCKTIDAMLECSKYRFPHYFFHQTDPMTLTSSGYFWTYPDPSLMLTMHSIAVSYNRDNMIWGFRHLMECAGVCTDDAAYYDSIMNSSYS